MVTVETYVISPLSPYLFLQFAWWGVESNWVHLARRPLIGLLWPAPADYDDGELGGMKIGRGNRSTGKRSAPASLSSPQIPLDQTGERTQAAAVGSQRLIAGAMARSSPYLTSTMRDCRWVLYRVIHNIRIVSWLQQLTPRFIPSCKHRSSP
jgi:hypothetical protein